MKSTFEFDGYNRKITVPDFEESVKLLAKTKKQGGTICMYLDMNRKGQDIAIVIGWQAGFDKSIQDLYSDGEYRLCAKIAYQPSNSMMQCDYDIDWRMPYDKKTGDCVDSEIVLYEKADFTAILKLLYLNWRWIDINWNKLYHEGESR